MTIDQYETVAAQPESLVTSLTVPLDQPESLAAPLDRPGSLAATLDRPGSLAMPLHRSGSLVTSIAAHLCHYNIVTIIYIL